MQLAASPVICKENTAGCFLTVGVLILQEKITRSREKVREKERAESQTWIVSPLYMKLAAGGAEQRGFVHQPGTQCGFQQGLDAVEQQRGADMHLYHTT